MGYLADIAIQTGISMWLLSIILIWTAIWKLLSLWKAARNSHVIWFIVLAIFNTVGILPILYIYVFSKFGKKVESQTKNSKPSMKKVIKKKVKKKVNKK